jgi:ABC-type sugar transport system ATPase subunit
MASITLDSVRKNFGGRRAVCGVSLDIPDGELMVLVGPSGSGKSTVLRLIAGLEQPTSGRVSIGGRDVTGLPPQGRDLAMVFQSYALYPHLSVRDNLSFGLRMRRVAPAEIEPRIVQAAELLGIEGLLDRKPSQLSGGQRQRVALGRAIVREPQAFLLDEPLSNLDPGLRFDTRTQLARLHRRLKATMVYVTHDQEEAMTLGTAIAVMKDGAVEQTGRPMAVFDRPSNTFVAQFLGSPAMNLLRGAVAPALESLAPPDRRADVLFGIRPHDIAIGSPEEAEVDARGVVETVESLGSARIVHIAAGDPERVVVRVVVPRDARVAPDETVGLRFRRDRVHVFDARTGCRLN